MLHFQRSSFPAKRSRELFEKYFVPGFAVVLFLLQVGAAYFLWRYLGTMSPLLQDRVFIMLAPLGIAFLARLTLGEASVTELAKPFEMSLPGISKHLKVLQRAGLIARGQRAQWRPCRLDAEPLKEVAEWAEGYRRFWEESFERLDKYLEELKQKEEKNDPTR